MASKTYRTPAQFAREFRRDVMRMADTLNASYHEEVHKEALRKLKSFPIQTLNSEYRSLVGQSDATSPDKISERPMRPHGIESKITNRHKAFHAIDFGRRRSKPYRRGRQKGMQRILGTEKAPRGMTRPTGEHLEGAGTKLKLQVRAIKNAERTLK